MRTRTGIFCERIIEAGWLLAAILAPLHFDIFTNRTFEPDKISLLRSLAIAVCAAWIIRFIEGDRGTPEAGSTAGTGAHGTIGKGRLPLSLRTPLIAPVLLYFLWYLLSAALSVLPGFSFFGSYTRLQGTYSMFSYGVFFLAILTFLRRKEQLDRLIDTIILTSIPVALYGILQHYGLDPTLWSMNMVDRPGSNMGNPIFLAAYLIMVMPFTLFKVIDAFPGRTRTDAEKTPKLRITLFATYLFAALSQLVCILFTQSRGPWLGLFVGLSFFILVGLIMLRPGGEGAARLTLKDAGCALLFSVCGLITLFIPAYLAALYRRKGFQWLWLAFLFQIMFVVGFIAVLNLSGGPLPSLKNAPYIGRLGHLSEAESATAKVRAIIWRGTIELIGSNPLRMIAGYGPETMKYVWDPHSPPELAHYEARNAAPDRSHNETYDLIVTTGLVGFSIYMALMGCVFYFGLKWLGFIRRRADALLFAALCGAGVVAGILLPRFIGGSYAFIGVGIPAGFISALFIYLIVNAAAGGAHRVSPGGFSRQLLTLALLSGIVAHYAEIHTGIAIASTRLYFFLYAALLVLMGLEQVGEADEPAHGAQRAQDQAAIRPATGKKQKKKAPHSPPQEAGKTGLTAFSRGIVLSWSVIAASILMAVGFGFITNTHGETDPISIISSALSTITVGGESRGSAGVLLLLCATYAAGLFVVLEKVLPDPSNQGGKVASPAFGPDRRKTRLLEAAGIYAALTLFVFLAGMVIQAALATPDGDPGKIVTFYYLAYFVFLLAIAFTIPGAAKPSPGLSRSYGMWLYPLIACLALFAAFFLNVRSIKADAYEKVALSLENRQQWDGSIRFHERAIALAPREDFYYLCLGRAVFGKIGTMPAGKEKEALFTQIYEAMNRAHEINPLNTDHLANLGLLFFKWAESDPSKEGRQEKLKKAHMYYEMAVKGSPRKIAIINNWARVYAAQGDNDGALSKLKQSLFVDGKAGATYFALGDLYAGLGKMDDAILAYRRGIELEPGNAEAIASLGYLYYKEGKVQEAMAASLKAVSVDGGIAKAHSLLSLIYYKSGRLADAVAENLKIVQAHPENMAAHRNLSIIYEQIGQIDNAIKHLEKLMALSPESERATLAPVLERLKTRSGSPAPSPGKP